MALQRPIFSSCILSIRPISTPNLHHLIPPFPPTHDSLSNFSHVRISGLSIPPESRLGDLRSVLGESQALQLDAAAQHGYSPNSQTPSTIVIDGSSPDHSGPCGTVNFDWFDFCNEVWHIARPAKESKMSPEYRLARLLGAIGVGPTHRRTRRPSWRSMKTTLSSRRCLTGRFLTRTMTSNAW